MLTICRWAHFSTGKLLLSRGFLVRFLCRERCWVRELFQSWVLGCCQGIAAVFRQWGSFLGQFNRMCSVFSMASQPYRQLGSTSWSILWEKELRRWCSDRSLWRQIEVFLFLWWCHTMGWMEDLMVMLLFWQVFGNWRWFSVQCFLKIDAISLGDRLLSMMLVDSSELWWVASLSATSFPCILVWLGIQTRVVFVPLDLRLWISSRMSGIALLPGSSLDSIAWIAEVEWLKIVIAGGLWSRLWAIWRACLMPCSYLGVGICTAWVGKWEMPTYCVFVGMF